jgi:hypothetical protein
MSNGGDSRERRSNSGAIAAAARPRAATAGAIRMGRTLGAAITKRREVGAAEAYQPVLELADLPGLGLLALQFPRRSRMPLACSRSGSPSPACSSRGASTARRCRPQTVEPLRIAERSQPEARHA